jgi:diacylglycerol kinase family enzyme
MKSTGRRLHLIANSKSGRGHGASLTEIAQRLCAEHGAELLTYEIDSPEELEPAAKKAVDKSVDENDIVVAAGGDGTLRTVAEVMRGSKASYAVIPCGTFNYFARSHRIPEDHEAAVRLALTGTAKPIRLGEINGRTFVINASLGLYAKAIQEREAKRKVFGRFRIVSILSTLNTMLRRHKTLHVKLSADHFTREIKTPMIFIGNNALQLRNLSLSVADCFKAQKLAVVTLKPVKGFEMLRVFAKGALKNLENEERLEQFCTETLVIHTKRKHHDVALDGEMFQLESPFEVKAVVGEVKMITPD